MREIHAKGVIFTRFDPSENANYAVFQPKITLASTLLTVPLKDVDSVDGHQ
jgi:hypothetical protein